MLLTPLQGVKKCACPSQKMQYFKRVLYKDSQVLFQKYTSYVSDRWPTKRNRIQEKYESRLPSFLSPFCQDVFTNIPSPFEDGNGTRLQLQYVVLGPRLKVINLNILPESPRHELKYSLKIAFMFFSIILKFQVPDINSLLGIRKKATVFDGPWSANVVLGPRLR